MDPLSKELSSLVLLQELCYLRQCLSSPSVCLPACLPVCLSAAPAKKPAAAAAPAAPAAASVRVGALWGGKEAVAA
eukprot:SAG22_NODE_1456_length_4385_cov_12.667289_9_plen_75_part_01